MKNFLLILCLTFAGCAWTTAHKSQIAATGSFLAQKAGKIALQVILNSATSQRDSDAKANYLDSLALGFRTEMPNIVTADDFSKVIGIWTPDKAHWEYLGSELGSAFNQASGPSDQRLEQIAVGLNAAAANERTK